MMPVVLRGLGELRGGMFEMRCKICEISACHDIISPGCRGFFSKFSGGLEEGLIRIS